jgi:hypothetical protein
VRTGSNASYIIVKAQTRWAPRSRAELGLPPGAKIISTDEIKGVDNGERQIAMTQ